MNTILYVIATWMLLQLLVLSLGARVASMRHPYPDDCPALQAPVGRYRAATRARSPLEKRDRRDKGSARRSLGASPERRPIAGHGR